jgi:hypothetical protein
MPIPITENATTENIREGESGSGVTGKERVRMTLREVANKPGPNPAAPLATRTAGTKSR